MEEMKKVIRKITLLIGLKRNTAFNPFKSEGCALKVYLGGRIITSFHPEMVFFANPGVNLRGCLCGVLQYASAQPLDFLELDKKSSFLDWKLASAQKAFLDGH